MLRGCRVSSRAPLVLVLAALVGLYLYYSNFICVPWRNLHRFIPAMSRNLALSHATNRVTRHSTHVTQLGISQGVTEVRPTPRVTQSGARSHVAQPGGPSDITQSDVTSNVIPSHVTRNATASVASLSGHTSTVRHAAPVRPCFRNAFSDVLLVIVYNYPYYESIKLFQSFYKPAFPNMLFCGPPDQQSKHVMAVPISRGVLGYECLGQAIRQNPGYSGYLYINDDVILNYWNLHNFDKNKIWQSPNSFSSTPMYGEIEGPWYWWRSPYGLPNCRQAYEQLSDMTLGHDSSSHLRENSNGSLRCFSGRSDVLYIPKKHAQAFSVLSFIFFSKKVFLEIAVPTILRILDKEQNIGHMPGYYIPGDVRKGDVRVTDSRFFWFIYFSKKDVWFIHPFKLHHGKLDRNFNVAMLKYFLIEKTKTLTTCEIK